MSSDDEGRSWMDSRSGDVSPHASWPHVSPATQAEVEQRFLEPGTTIDFNKVAPVPRWVSPLSLRFVSEGKETLAILQRIASMSIRVQRKLTQEEIDGISDIISRKAQVLSYVPIGAGICAAAHAYHGRKKFRFPMWTPKPGGIVNPEFWPGAWEPLLRGQRARYAWHAMRVAAYYPLWLPVSMAFWVSNFIAMSTAEIERDYRFQGYFQELKDRWGLRGSRSRIQRQSSGQEPGLLPSPPGRQPVSAAEQARMEAAFRKASRSSTTDWQDQDAENQDSFSDQDVDAQRQSQQPSRRFPVSGGSAWGRRAPQAPAQAAPPPPSSTGSSPYDAADPFDDDDDASPVAASARAAVRQRSQSQSPRGLSSWERIRQEAKADAPPWKRGDRSAQDTAWSRMRQDTTPTDKDRGAPYDQEKYTYSESERSKSQKDFDAMLEAERKGVDQGGRAWRKS